MTEFEPDRPVPFFKAMRRGFAERLTIPRGRGELVARLTQDAVAALDRSCAEIDGLACRQRCSACCSVRVVATAPEILYAARAVRAAPRKAAAQMKAKIAASARAAGELGQEERMALDMPCPFVGDALCTIYPARPLACRSHVSFSERACLDALAGEPVEIPVSARHMAARGLIQNALQAALRERGLGWGIYELTRGLRIALKSHTAEADWLKGEDVFREAQIDEVPPQEMARTFDAIAAMPG